MRNEYIKSDAGGASQLDSLKLAPCLHQHQYSTFYLIFTSSLSCFCKQPPS